MEKVTVMVEKRLGNHPVIWALQHKYLQRKNKSQFLSAVRIQDGCRIFSLPLQSLCP